MDTFIADKNGGEREEVYFEMLEEACYRTTPTTSRRPLSSSSTFQQTIAYTTNSSNHFNYIANPNSIVSNWGVMIRDIFR
jgi:hypothetical protein